MKLSTTISDTILDKPPAFTPTGFLMDKVHYSDIKKMFNALIVDDIANVIKGHIDKNIVYLGEFSNTEGELKCRITIFEIIDSTDTVDTKTDWFYYSKLWFRFNNAFNTYEAFMDYIEEYREVFSVDFKKPLVSFYINF